MSLYKDQKKNQQTGFSYAQALQNYHDKTDFPAFNKPLDEESLLAEYHPDQQHQTMTKLQIGANTGEACHQQIADLLQANARIEASDLAAANIEETDILIIGGGGAGCAAALMADRAGAKVILATKLRLGDSNTVMAEGGIQASVEKDDTPQAHFNDTYKAGHQEAEKELLKQLVLDGPETIDWLIQQGMQFDLDNAGDLLTRQAGGTTANRVVFFRDYTGLEMMRVLREAVVNSSVEVKDYSPAIELLSNESGQCAGAMLSLLKENRLVQIKARAVIIATGGIGRLHINQFPTSNHFGATGDGLVLAYRLGAKLRDLDSFQYHPTGIAYPQHLSGTLITEGLRSSGAYIINALGERFIDELKPRDVVAAAIIKECREGRGIHRALDDDESLKGVWLDTPGLEARKPGILKKRFPKLVQLGLKSNIDICQTPMLVYPTLHYQNGGVVIDTNGLSSVPGLYCVGEVSGGIHGRNRLMGNALLDVISFGRRAGYHAANKGQGMREQQYVGIEHVEKFRRELIQHKQSAKIKTPLLFPEYALYDTPHYLKSEPNSDLKSDEKT
ncbi:FAD-dependent oxidoreductase [sulfur-oxidizing endosymbiont of Gigantopelta aegis]|uniref:FAD-dependent oxidoreductase n=1 Tax=sulfur-oxidizing endosymbiont of Gigantopelta aegis TaxID=2794934 RepID=UPI0018DC8687|nr:FAD-dependent oxidoreductase [sulfur-oxidizing endosymbiont of Gigantopelta aegis]